MTEKKGSFRTFREKYGTLILCIVCFILLIPPVYNRYFRIGPLSILGQVKAEGREYITQDAKPFKMSQLRGKTVIVNFIFTSCLGPCIPMSNRMSELNRSLRLDKRAHCLSVSVNPSYDSPEVLKRYAERFGADFDTWTLITGAEEDLEALMREECMLAGSEDHMSHSTKFVLLDRFGRIRGYYDGQDKKEMAKLYKHASFLMRNKEE